MNQQIKTARTKSFVISTCRYQIMNNAGMQASLFQEYSVRKVAQYMLVAVLCMSGFAAHAYETSTHSELTGIAVEKSVIKTTPLLSDIGAADFSVFFDLSDQPASHSVAGLVQFGAVWEDEQYLQVAYQHFFDPQFDNFDGRGLRFLTIAGHSSPDWILADNNRLNENLDGVSGSLDVNLWSTNELGVYQSGDIRKQQYSYRDGQQWFYKALTGSSPNERNSAFSRAFQTIGHVVHHIQDMAQPQHTRNDIHAHTNTSDLNHPWSFYERYTHDKINDRIQDIVLNPDKSLKYPVPTEFNKAREFWYTPDRASHFKGMAEFTSQNYVSFGTQYAAKGLLFDEITHHPNLPLPNGLNHDKSPKVFRTETFDVYSVFGTKRQAKMKYVIGDVYDENSPVGSKPGQHLSATSLLNIFLYQTANAAGEVGGVQGDVVKSMVPGIYMENSKTYEDGYNVLFPRAVAFSAGLINHFFRGKLDFWAAGNNTWALKNTGTQAMNGFVTIYAENGTGIRTPISVATQRNLIAGQSVSIPLLVPPGTRRLIAAFRGQIGTEGEPSLSSEWYATAGKVISYAEPVTEAQPEIIIVGAVENTSVVNSRKAFRWSSKSPTDVKLLSAGDGGLTSEAFGISGDGTRVVGITTGIRNLNQESICDLMEGQEQSGNCVATGVFADGTFGQRIDIATSWRAGEWWSYYLNGGSPYTSTALRTNQTGSIVYGHGYDPRVSAFRDFTWSWQFTVSAFGGTTKYPLSSSDGSVTLSNAGGKAFYTYKTEMKQVPLPNGFNSMTANHVVVIK